LKAVQWHNCSGPCHYWNGFSANRGKRRL